MTPDQSREAFAHKWVREAEELGEKTDHVQGLSEYRIDAAEQGFQAGWQARAAVEREAVLEEVADFVFKNWDSKVSTAISDAIRALSAPAANGAKEL